MRHSLALIFNEGLSQQHRQRGSCRDDKIKARLVFPFARSMRSALINNSAYAPGWNAFAGCACQFFDQLQRFVHVGRIALTQRIHVRG